MATAILVLLNITSFDVQHAVAENIIIVNSTSDDPGTCAQNICLRGAIMTANQSTAPTTITFSVNGVITLTNPIVVGGTTNTTISIDGSDNMNISIDGGKATELLKVGATAILTLKNLTFSNAHIYSSGGAIYNSSNLTIINCVFDSNVADNQVGAYGGGIFNDTNGILTVNDSTFNDNSAGDGGGGIYSQGTSVTLNNDVFSSNVADDGGAIDYSAGTLTIANSMLSDNTSLYGPGGVEADLGSGSLNLVDSSINSNHGADGGGFSISSNQNTATMTIKNSTISDNTSNYGGGISNSGTASLLIDGTTIANNYANNQGGGVYNYGIATISNSTITSNFNGIGQNPEAGGGIFNSSTARLTIAHSTIANNLTDDQGAGIYNQAGGVVNMISTILNANTLRNAGTGPDFYGVVVTSHAGEYNLVSNSAGVTGFMPPTDLLNVQANLEGLSSNGGFTQTLALANSSPAIGKGDCAGVTTNPVAPAVSTDQRGVSRKVNSGIGCDIGAYENNTPAILSFIVNSTSDDVIQCSTPNIVCLRNAVTYASTFSVSTTISFNISGQITLSSTLNIDDMTANPNITIDGSGQSIVIDGAAESRIFNIGNGSSVKLNDLTLRNGYDTSTNGGGAVLNHGVLVITNSTLLNNETFNSNGGAINNVGSASGGILTISNSTLSNNSALNSGGTNSDGGAINSNGTVTISNSTIADNNAINGGGGIFSNSASFSIGNSTLSGNSTQGSGGGIYNQGTSNVLSTVIAGDAASGSDPDVIGVFNSAGYNLIGNRGDSSGFAAIGDQTGLPNVGLLPLAFYGGPTQTIGLLPISPATGKGYCGGLTGLIPSVSADQRNVFRKESTTGCDVGSYEHNILRRTDTIGIFRNGTFYLRLHNTQGVSDLAVTFGSLDSTKYLPVVGDWTAQGADEVGVFNQTAGAFTLCDVSNSNANNNSACQITANQIGPILGNPGDTPLAGRWTIYSTNSGVGVYRPTNGILYLKNQLSTGYADYEMVLGIPGDEGITGDWIGKGFDSPGIYRPSTSGFYLSNQVTNGIIYSDINLIYGSATDLPIAGDWPPQGSDGIGMFRPSNGYVFLKDQLVSGPADISFIFGNSGDKPVAGHWETTYPSTMPPAILVAKTPTPKAPTNGGSVPGGNEIGG